MFPKQNFSVKITDERLLDAKRATIKRSSKTRNYSLMKTASAIFISPAEPLTRKDYFFGLIESKVDLTNEKSGEYQVEVGLKRMVKAIFFLYIPLILLTLYQTVTLPNFTYSLSDIIRTIVIPIMLFVLYRQTRKSVTQMERRLQEDKSIFAGV